MTLRTTMAVPAIALALLLAPALAGCGLVESAVDGATGGSVSVGGELPKGWPDEVPVVARYLGGELRQRRTGLGWRSLTDLPAPAAEPTLEVLAVDAAFGTMAATLFWVAPIVLVIPWRYVLGQLARARGDRWR